MEGTSEEDIFLGRQVRLRQTKQNIILFKAPWRRNKSFLVDGLVANTEHHPGLVEDNMEEKKMIPGGWKRQREASNNQQDSGSIEGHNTKPSSHRNLQLFSLILSCKSLGISLWSDCSTTIFYLPFLSVPETA